MATISYQLKGTVINYGGGVVFVDNYRSYDVGSNLTAGSGTITIDAADTALVAALDGYAALRRSGSSDAGVPAATTKNGPLIVSRPDPVTVAMLAQLGVDGTWTTTPSSLVVSTSQVLAGLGDGSTDDTAAINAQLTAQAGRRIVGMPGRNYLISAPLVVQSGTTLDMTGCTITLKAGSNCNLLQTPAVAVGTGGSRCSDVTVIGAIWDKGANTGGNNGLHGLVFYKADRLTVRGVRYKSTAGKYALYFVDCADFTVQDIWFPGAASDGVHLGGSCRRGVVRNVGGTTNDDLCVILGKDNPIYLFGDEGDCYDVLFDGIFANGVDTNAFKILGGNGLTVKRITARNIKGTMTGSARTQAAVWIGDDNAFPQMVGGQLEAITIEDVEVAINKSTASMVKINPTVDPDTITLRDLKIATGDTLGRVVQIVAGQLSCLELDGVTGKPATITDGHVVQVADTVYTSCLRRLVARRLNVTWPSGSGALVAARSAGATFTATTSTSTNPTTLTAVSSFTNLAPGTTLSGAGIPAGTTVVSVNTGASTLVMSNAATATASGVTVTALQTLEDVQISDSVCTNVFQAVDTNTNTRVKLSNVRMIGATNSFNVRALGVLIADVTNCDLGGTLAVAGGGTARSRSFGLRCDASKLTKTASDMCTNTNAGFGTGIGQLVCDGTNWKNLFSGTTA